MSNEAVSLALEYISLGGKSSPEDKDQYFQFDSNLKTIFHTTLLENASQVTLPILSLIDSDFSVTEDPNPEVKQRWLPLGLSIPGAQHIVHNLCQDVSGRLAWWNAFHTQLQNVQKFMKIKEYRDRLV